MKTKVATIIGNVGSGKTTAIQILQKALQVPILDADTLFQTTNPFRVDFLEDMPRWAFANELWLTLERAKLLSEHIKKNKNTVSIVDSGLLMSWVYTYGHYSVGKMTEHEWNLYINLYQQITKDVMGNMSVISLSYSFPTLLSRIQKRGRDYELALYSQGYLEQIEKGLDALKTKLKNNSISMLEIKEDQIQDFEKNQDDAERLIQIVKKTLEL